jgi:hypothetical protein
MSIIKNILKNQYVTTFVSILLLLFSATIDRHYTQNTKLSSLYNKESGAIQESGVIQEKHILLKLYAKIFNHHFFRLAYLLLIIYIFNYDVKIALSLSILFIMVNISITNNMIKKSFGQFENFIELEHFTF